MSRRVFAAVASTVLGIFVGVYLYSDSSLRAQTTSPSTPPESPAAPSPAPEVPPATAEIAPAPSAPPTEEPAEEEQHPIAFNYLPKTKMGYVDWVEAIKQGIIKPKESLDPNAATMRPLDFDIIFKVKGELPDVAFPHYPHTLWLDCRNCHPGIFLMKQGSNPVTMAKILQGEFCGRCHGTVAFPVSDCFRCHSRPK